MYEDVTAADSVSLTGYPPMEGEAADIDEVLFTREALHERIAKLGARLANDYRDLSPVVLCVLKGAFLFHADLVRAIQPCPPHLQLDFLSVQSYGAGQETSGTITVDQWCSMDVTNRHVILVDDICDTGLTLKYVMEALRPKCASLKSVVLLDKISRRRVKLAPDYAGFKCPDKFVVGYGLDFDQRYRSLPFVGVLKQSVVEAANANGKED